MLENHCCGLLSQSVLVALYQRQKRMSGISLPSELAELMATVESEEATDKLRKRPPYAVLV